MRENSKLLDDGENKTRFRIRLDVESLESEALRFENLERERRGRYSPPFSTMDTGVEVETKFLDGGRGLGRDSRSRSGSGSDLSFGTGVGFQNCGWSQRSGSGFDTGVWDKVGAGFQNRVEFRFWDRGRGFRTGVMVEVGVRDGVEVGFWDRGFGMRVGVGVSTSGVRVRLRVRDRIGFLDGDQN
ncbi:hypothetical protein TIFTF001_012693 [Ficus carica]|uniref:Uncharacterized protein n=1 Tax=Ficus carica TaxID=3494 RepID=A0AA88DI45_FICCA|nr:hypothetical protein TIFTF001_012693 [Ficus carica]